MTESVRFAGDCDDRVASGALPWAGRWRGIAAPPVVHQQIIRHRCDRVVSTKALIKGLPVNCSSCSPQIAGTLGHFWRRSAGICGEDGVKREKQLLIDFLCASAGGPTYYRGRDMLLCHRGMHISESDWNVILGHAAATLAKFQVPDAEQHEVVAFVQGLEKEIVE